MKGGQGSFSPRTKGTSFKRGEGGASMRHSNSKANLSFKPGTDTRGGSGAQRAHACTFSSIDGAMWENSKVNIYTSGQSLGHFSFFTGESQGESVY
eukprot:scaffold132055_cov19-Tisochrysis_lutea.AAC.1